MRGQGGRDPQPESSHSDCQPTCNISEEKRMVFVNHWDAGYVCYHSWLNMMIKMIDNTYGALQCARRYFNCLYMFLWGCWILLTFQFIDWVEQVAFIMWVRLIHQLKDWIQQKADPPQGRENLLSDGLWTATSPLPGFIAIADLWMQTGTLALQISVLPTSVIMQANSLW